MIAHRTGAGHSKTLADTSKLIWTLVGEEVNPPRWPTIVISQLQRGVVEVLLTQPPLVSLRPGSPAAVDDPLAQKQFG